MNGSASQSIMRQADHNGNGILALFVDDEPGLLELAKAFVENEGGVNIDTASSATDAMDMLSLHRYDAIVSDYQMLGMNGIELLRSIRGKGDTTPFVLFTGRGREEVVIEALNCGADFYLQKGGDPKSQFAELIHILRHLVSKSRAERALRESEERYRTYAQNFKGIAFRGDTDFKPAFMQGAVEAITGYTQEDFLKGRMRWIDIVLPEDLPTFLDRTEILRTTPGQTLEREYRIRRKDGEVRWVREVVSNRLDESVMIDAVEGLVFDITDKKMAESAVEHNLQHFKELIENTSDIIAVIDNGGLIRYVSPSVERVLGYTPKDILDTPIQQLVHPEEVQAVNTALSEILIGYQVRPFVDYRLRHKDGSWITLEATGRLSDKFDNGPRIIINAREVTERRLTEEALRQSEQRYRAIFENTGTATFIVEEDKTISLANSEFEKLSGYSREELEGKMKWTPFMRGSDLERLKEYHRLRRINPSLAPRKFEVEFIDRAERAHNILATVDMIPGTKASIASYMDITELKRTQSMLEKKTQEQNLLLDNIEAMVWYATDPETYGAVNRARAEFIGMRKEDLEGRKLRDLIPIKEECEQCIASNTEAFEKKRKVQAEEWVTTARGERRLVQITKTPMLDENGDVKFVVATGLDITKARRSEEDLELARSKLNLCGSLIRHDAMNQLTVIMGAADLAKDQSPEPKIEKYMRMILKSAASIGRALDFAREYQEMGTKEPVWKNLKECIGEARAALGAQDISVEADNCDFEVLADPLLMRVFYNLIDNAVKHGCGAETIRMYCSPSGDELRLICEDDGVGIPEPKKASLFSAGHGLHMVKDILAMTGMKIVERGEYGKGARFEIIVPKGCHRPAGQAA